ncbi:hypothetical protein OWC53_02320 [Pectobacterium brasiliense]|uniref:hypothetical protein n=1 Tax=Pectobacterium brasiliense TaxID=180957 RepID=UPI00227A890B|nr:hypothetical protein [Pectobacterium brasiliense]WGL28451.1 hypothetical protein OWC53_02320 [Pectobacterium brasiliense]
MTTDALRASFEQLSQDAMDGKVPSPASICTDCAGLGVPFSINGSNGPREADQWLGIPSHDGAATPDWFTQNPWITDRVENFRNTYFIQLMDKLGELYGDAYLAEFHAFQSAQGLEFHCLEDDMETENYVTPAFLMEVARGEITERPSISCNQTNCVFLGSRIYFWTFTTARYREDSLIGADGQRLALTQFEWTVSGLFDPIQAAQALARHYQQAKTLHKLWTRVLAVAQIGFGVLSIIPVVGVARGLFGLYKGVRYTFAAIDAALAANAIANGSTTLITGEGIDHGEALFESLGKAFDPKDGKERGRQVFMFINLAMLTPAALGATRWVLRKVRGDVPVSARFDTDAISEEERRRLGGHTSGEPLAIELRGRRPARRNDETGDIEWRNRPSLDTNSSQIALTTATGKANYFVMGNTLRSNLTMLIIQRGGSLKVIGRICKVVGDAGEEAFAAAMVEKMGFKAERILGYSNKAGVPSRFGLTNKSGHGLDMLVWVPPPPSLTVRAPTTNTMRHSIDGVNGTPAPTQTLHFKEDTLLVIETKATLGGTKTPGFNSTQGTGAGKLADLKAKIGLGSGGWSKAKMLEVDPSVQDKINAIEDAVALGKIKFLHAQVFFDSQGALSKTVGNGSGIQLNAW